MPPVPTFDYYVELELERSASLQDITSSFRRLALIHHPDRNHDNQQEATVRFQRLQLAYETLSDATRRARYDNNRLTSSSPNFDFDDNNNTWDDEDYNTHDFFPRSRTGFPFGGGFDFSSDMPTYFFQVMNEALEAYREALRDRARKSKETKEKQMHEEAKRRRRDEVERARLRAQQEAAKMVADLANQTQKNNRYEDEQEKQKRRWKELNAVTTDERLVACLHSDFCRKIQQKKKFKCSACSAKRGLIAFECPHCSAFLCQLCVTNFSDRRKRLGKSGEPNAAGTAQDTQNHGEDVDQANKIKSTDEAETISTNSPSSQGKTSSKKKKANKKNKSGPAELESTETPPTSSHYPPPKSQVSGVHGDGSKETPVEANSGNYVATPSKASQPQQATDTNPKTAQGNKVVSAKSEATKTPSSSQKLPVENTTRNYPELTQQKTATAAGAASSRQTIVSPDDPNGKPQLNSQEPRYTAKPTPGATRGFIRNTKPTQGAPGALLRQAMEQFGTVISLNIKNKYVGTAQIEFSDNDGLCKAMAASPVAVSDCVAVDVVELKECRKCGKFGHVAAHCRFAKASGGRGRC
ncbi:hypothetical protein VMCG_06497 [Cytospora schulzeri]|uniref:J domain-containing protein n=1 Tax=Cytospora schulzeri TaxID=448051 RepID=A0A423WBJ1_9PEZI|nr:hypothetical protein VMCG_06497 [Valsa malicola]